jgi:hypothetical protein
VFLYGIICAKNKNIITTIVFINLDVNLLIRNIDGENLRRTTKLYRIEGGDEITMVITFDCQWTNI